jgi:hypothetical protein
MSDPWATGLKDVWLATRKELLFTRADRRRAAAFVDREKIYSKGSLPAPERGRNHRGDSRPKVRVSFLMLARHTANNTAFPAIGARWLKVCCWSDYRVPSPECKPEFCENTFRNSTISSWDGGQSVSHVLQWNTKAPDFKVSSNSCCVNATVWLWLFGQSISNLMRSLMSPPVAWRVSPNS